MSALKGTLTYARFYVEGDLPDDFHARYLKAIQQRVMRPLEAAEPDLERHGWCRLGEPFDLELEHQDVFFNEFLNLGLRHDRWVIPGPLLRVRLREAEAAYLAQKGRERLSKKEKTELKELVSKKLRKQLSPATRSFDLSWSLDEKLVRFFSQSPRPIGLMTDLFYKTFGLKLVPEAPYTLAARLGMSKAQETEWQMLEPSELSALEV